MTKIVLNDLYDYENLKVYQYDTHFKFSIDSLLLAEFVNIKKTTKKILDLCTGNGVIPLVLSKYTNAHIDALEIQKDIYDLAQKNIAYNKLDKQVTVYNADILKLNEFKKDEKYDIITCNPPYFKVDNRDYINNFSPLAIARHELTMTLEDIFKIAKSHLNTRGELYIVHRVERLDEIIIYANMYKLNVKKIALIKTKEENNPTILLVKCIKDASNGIKISNIVNIEKCTTYQNMFKEEV